MKKKQSYQTKLRSNRKTEDTCNNTLQINYLDTDLQSICYKKYYIQQGQ